MTGRVSRIAAALGVSVLLALPASAQQAAAPALAYSQPLAPAAVMRVQERLRDRGAYQGRVDGIWGRTASRRWSASSRPAGCR